MWTPTRSGFRSRRNEKKMAESASSTSLYPNDDWLTVCAISVLAGMLANVVHEGLGHSAIALLTGAKSGVLSTVAWSSSQDSRLVAAGGTLANLAAALVFWMALRGAKNASSRLRFFLLIGLAFNLFDGTGYFLFSGFTNFGDWAVVIAGLPGHWLWQGLLVVCRDLVLLRSRDGCGERTGAIRWCSQERLGPLLETHVDSLFLLDSPGVRERSPESAGYPVAVAIGLARNCRRPLRPSMAEVLHSERNRPGTKLRSD